MARILGIDHITFAVRDLDRRMSCFERVFGVTPLFRIKQGSASVVSFEIGGQIFNFASEPLDGKGAFAEFLRKKGECLHHLAFAVDDMGGLRKTLEKSGIHNSRWELEADQEARDEVMIEQGAFPATLQFVRWENHTPPTTDQWVEKTRKLFGESQVTDLRKSRKDEAGARATRAKIIGLDHLCYGVKDRDHVIAFVENVLDGRLLASLSRGEEAVSNFMDIAGQIHNFVTAPEDGTSFFADFLRKKGADLHHVGVSVDNLDAFKQGMAANGIAIPRWELEGDPAIRDEVLIGARHAPTVFQVIHWATAPPASTREWMALEEKYTGGRRSR